MLVRLVTPLALGLALVATPRLARAQETPAAPHAPAEPPATAFAALVRVEAAYEYGDMLQVVDAARPVAEGTLPSSNVQRARALRFLGIGLYLTNRALGAENAFAELLRVDPTARLDPTTTRPEVVAFFETIRHQHMALEQAREQSSRSFVWNLLPPAGQFQNGQPTKGWVIGSVEFASLATLGVSRLILYSWHNPDNTYGTNASHNSDARVLKNIVAPGCLGILIATYLYGVVDGIVHYRKPPDESGSALGFVVSPADGGLRLTF